MNNPKERSRTSSYSISYHDDCNECDRTTMLHCCNKCGDGVCLNTTCCTTFPHYNNSTYVVCTSCIRSIDKNLYVLIDLAQLASLKNKITTKSTFSKRHGARIAKKSK